MLKSYPDDINSQIKGCRNMGHFAYDGTFLHAVLQGIVSICRVMIFGTLLIYIKRTKTCSYFILFSNSLLSKDILDKKILNLSYFKLHSNY